MSDDNGKSKLASHIGIAVTIVGVVCSGLLWAGKYVAREEANSVRVEVGAKINAIDVKQAETTGELKVINVKIDTLLDRKADKNSAKKARD